MHCPPRVRTCHVLPPDLAPAQHGWAAPADGAKPTEKKSEGRHSLPDKELLSTPYAAAHRYLASAEDMAHKDGATFDKGDAEKLSNEIFAEQNNPLYNPDLQVASQSRSWLNSVF